MLYPFAIELGDEKHAHGVIVPDVPGCFSGADEYDDILSNVTEALTFHFEGLAEDGEPIPLPTRIENHIDNPDYAGMSWAWVDIDISKYQGKTEKINVTMPSRLIHLIDEKVASNKALYKSRSGYLSQLAQENLMSARQ